MRIPLKPDTLQPFHIAIRRGRVYDLVMYAVLFFVNPMSDDRSICLPLLGPISSLDREDTIIKRIIARFVSGSTTIQDSSVRLGMSILEIQRFRYQVESFKTSAAKAFGCKPRKIIKHLGQFVVVKPNPTVRKISSIFVFVDPETFHAISAIHNTARILFLFRHLRHAHSPSQSSYIR